jgi:antitoxin CptB
LREFALTESSISSAGLDPRRRRVLFRSWHRGMREMDIIYGKFADSEIAKLSEAELDDYEVLMELPDRDVLMFVTGEADTPENFDTPVFRRMKAFHTHSGPIFG